MPRGVAPVVAEAGPTAVKRSTARRSTAGSTAIREHAVTAVGIRTNETLQHTFRTGRRAAATRATHGRAGEAPPTVCQQPARVVRDESWDESWTPYYNLYQAPHVTLLVQMVPPGANPEIRIRKLRKFIFCVGIGTRASLESRDTQWTHLPTHGLLKCGLRERRWVLLKIPRGDIDGVGEGK